MRTDPPLAGSDAERRTSAALATDLRSRGHAVAVETFWCRPNWPLAQAWHVALAVAGSLLSVDSPHVGAAMIGIALIALLGDWSLLRSPGRLLTAERASQNVISEPGGRADKVSLVITATYDAGRAGLARRLPRPRLGWLGLLAALMIWTLITALLRIEGSRDTLISVLQLVPTFGLILGAALLLDLAFDRGQDSEDGSASTAATALARALDASPPAQLIVELVLTGAGADYGLGLRDYLRRRRRSQNSANTVVLGIGSDSAGAPHFLSSDGPLLPLGYYRVLRQLASGTMPASRATGCSAALPARMRGLPALSIEGGATSDRVQAALLLVDAIDEHIGSLRHEPVAAG